MFDDLFDFNDDGSMDTAERAMELGFIDEITNEDEYGDDEEEDDDYGGEYDYEGGDNDE